MPVKRSMLRVPQLPVTVRISMVTALRSILRVTQLQVTVRISSVMALRSMLRVTQLQVAPWISIVTVKRSIVTAARSILRLAHPGGDIDATANFHDLYNGNISAWSQSLPNEYHWGADHWDATGDNLTFVYRYDQLNRLKHARASDLLDGSNDWGSIPNNLPTKLYRSDYWYDANGNITEAWRWDQFGTMYDKLEYKYHTVNGRKRTNRLYHLFDPSAAGVVDPTDPLDQGVADIDVPGNPTFNNDPLTVNSGGNNYRYDPLGNLVQDTREEDLSRSCGIGALAFLSVSNRVHP